MKPIVRHPGRMTPVPSSSVEGLLPAGNVITLCRVYPAEMQPDSLHKWSREFLLDRIKEHGAFFSASLRGSNEAETTIGVPSTDGGFYYVVKTAQPDAAKLEPAKIETIQVADYQLALKMVLDHEGGLQSLVSDAGNAGGSSTNRGITFATLKEWYNKQGRAAPSDADVKNLSLAETAAIYEQLYWKTVGGPLLSDQGIATVMLDAGVVMGPVRVVKMAQEIASASSLEKLKVDGAMGPKTAGVINTIAAKDRRIFLEPLCYKLQSRFLDCIAMSSQNISWEKVWMRRACDWMCLIY